MRLPTTRGMADRTLLPGLASWHESVQVARFDWLWPLINGGNAQIDGVKIDVQGMEIEVLRGMRSTLMTQRPMLAVELHVGVSRSALLRMLNDAGYTEPP